MHRGLLALAILPGLLVGLDADQEAVIIELLQRQQYAKAQDGLMRIVRLEPMTWQWWRYLGVTQCRRGGPRVAAASLRRSLSLPDAGAMNRHTLYLYAEVLLAAGFILKAEATVDLLAERYPFFHERLSDRRDVLLRRLAEQQRRIDGAQHRRCRHLAQQAHRQGDWGLALLASEECVLMLPLEIQDEINRWQGRALLELGATKQAWQHLQRLPADDDAWRTGAAQARCLHALEQMDACRRLVTKIRAACRQRAVLSSLPDTATNGDGF